MRIRTNLLIGCLFLVAPLMAQERHQEALAAACVGAGSQVRALQEQLDLVAAPSLSPGNESGTAFIQRGIIQRSWSLVLANSSTLDGYKFPVALQGGPPATPPVNCSEDGTQSINRLRQSTFTVQYVPLIVKRPQGHPNGVTSSSDRKGSVNYTLPLLGIGTIEDAASAIDKEIRKRLPAVLGSFVSKPTELFTEAEQQQLLNIAKEAREAVFSRLSLNAVASYTRDTRSDMPNAVSLAFNSTKALSLTIDQPNWLLNTSLGETWLSSSSSVGSYSKTTASIGVDRSLPKQFVLSLAPSWDHYQGSSFPGISGLSDPMRRDDLTIKTALTLKVADGSKLVLAISEEHLGTTDRDLAVGVNFNYKLPLQK